MSLSFKLNLYHILYCNFSVASHLPSSRSIELEYSVNFDFSGFPGMELRIPELQVFVGRAEGSCDSRVFP